MAESDWVYLCNSKPLRMVNWRQEKIFFVTSLDKQNAMSNYGYVLKSLF